jgi:hypothetical protein
LINSSNLTFAAEAKETLFNDEMFHSAGQALTYSSQFNQIPYSTTQAHMQELIGGASNGVEIVVGIKDSNNESKAYAYTYQNDNVAYYDEYPEINKIDAKLLSNIVSCSCMIEGTDGKDFCMIGYDEEISDVAADGNITLLCGSMQNQWSILNYDSNVFYYDEYASPLFPYSNFSKHPPLIHAAQSQEHTAGGSDLNEILTPYGIFALNSSSVLYDKLDVVFSLASDRAEYIPVDYGNSGKEDIVGLSSTNLYIYNDNFKYIGCETGSSDNVFGCFQLGTTTITPCNTITWKNGTQVEIIVTPVDGNNADQGRLSIRVQAYYGDDNLQDTNWTDFVESGTPIPIMFSANKTITNGVLAVFAKSEYNNATNESVAYLFTVGQYGAEYPDSSCNPIDERIAASLNNAGLTTNATTNIRNTVRGMFGADSDAYDSIFGFGIIILFVALTIFILVKAGITDGRAIIVFGICAGVVGWLFSVFTGFISAWTIIVGIIFSGVILGFKFFMAGNNPPQG